MFPEEACHDKTRASGLLKETPQASLVRRSLHRSRPRQRGATSQKEYLAELKEIDVDIRKREQPSSRKYAPNIPNRPATYERFVPGDAAIEDR